MPGAESIGVRRDADTLHFSGDLLTAAIRSAWVRTLPMLSGVRDFDLTQVRGVDSAGIALLAECAQRAGGVAIVGDPPGLSALRTAYRLTPALAYAG